MYFQNYIQYLIISLNKVDICTYVNFIQPVDDFKEGSITQISVVQQPFTSLPFQKIEKTGILLSLLVPIVKKDMPGQNPKEIIEYFFRTQTDYTEEKDKLDLLFRFIQYGERQVVLLMHWKMPPFSGRMISRGPGTLKQIETETKVKRIDERIGSSSEDFAVRLVLTAHPTQFYPDSVLGIIRVPQMHTAANNITEINLLLQQLVRPFLQTYHPTPVDETNSLMIWYLKNIFILPSAWSINGWLSSYRKLPKRAGNPWFILDSGPGRPGWQSLLSLKNYPRSCF